MCIICRIIHGEPKLVKRGHRKSKLTPEQVANIRFMRKQGVRLNAIGRVYKISAGYVHQLCK